MMSLDKIFGLYTICFLGVTVLIGIGERMGLFSNQMIGWIFMALSLAIYVIIGVLTRTSNPDQYYVAGRGVPSIYNGMATGSDWMSAASFISMAGLISALGFFGLGYVMGWTGGYLLARRAPGPVPPPVRRLYHPRLSGRPLRREHRARRRCGRGHRLLVHLPHRPGHGRRPHRRPLHRHRLQHRRVRRSRRRALLLGARGHEVGHLDPGGPVHHPDHFLPGAGRVHVVDALLRFRFRN